MEQIQSDFEACRTADFEAFLKAINDRIQKAAGEASIAVKIDFNSPELDEIKFIYDSAYQAAAARYMPKPGEVIVPIEPTHEMFTGLGRDILLWMECTKDRSAKSMYQFLANCEVEIPDCMKVEVEPASGHVSKGDILALTYRAMISAYKREG